MKKIKYLLGFSIVGVGLLINNIFAQSCNVAKIQYADQNNNTILFTVGASKHLGGYYSGFFTVAPEYMLFTGLQYASHFDVLSFDSYILTGYYSLGSAFTESIFLGFNSITIPYGTNYNWRLFKPTNGENYSGELSFKLRGFSSSCPGYNIDLASYSLHINGDSTCINKDVLINGNCDFDSYVFQHSSIPYSIINSYSVHDSMFDGVEYYKSPVVFSTKNTYSFGFTNYSGTVYDNNWSDPDTFFNFRTVVYTDTAESIQYIDGIYFARLYDNLYNNNSSDFKIIGIFGSGTDELDYQFLYNLYNCPYNALTPYDCTFLTGGYLLASSGSSSSSFITGNSFDSCNSGSIFCPGFYSFPILLTEFDYYSVTPFWTYNSDNGYLIYHISHYGSVETSSDYASYSLKLSNSPAVSDILSGTTPPDLPDDTIPIYDRYNHLPFSSLYYRCLGPTYNTSDGKPPIDCLNPDGTLIDVNDYENCFYTISGSGGLLSNNMYCNIEGNVQEMVWVQEGSGGYYTFCTGDNCGIMFVFGPDSLSFNSSFQLSTGLIEDMITNITGWVARCPYPYTDFQLGKSNQFLKYLKTLGFKYDPFIFINCVVAGFNHGRHIIDDMAFSDTFEHPLLYGDTSQHRLLFVFLDFIVILGLLGLISFIKKVF